MTHAEVGKVLRKISTFDGRIVDDETIRVWHRQVKDGNYIKAMQAVSMLSAQNVGPITPAMLNQGIDALWAENAQYTPADDKADREGADPPENLDAMSLAWDDPVQFARERRIYQDQLDRDGYIGPVVS
jgi:hypothetical protein